VADFSSLFIPEYFESWQLAIPHYFDYFCLM
jgi:hypothetical protein